MANSPAEENPAPPGDPQRFGVPAPPAKKPPIGPGKTDQPDPRPESGGKPGTGTPPGGEVDHQDDLDAEGTDKARSRQG
jgi:hypothetical protein